MISEIYNKLNYRKQLINKTRRYFNFDILEEEYKKYDTLFTSKEMEQKDKDTILFNTNQAYSELNRLLHTYDGEIVVEKALNIRTDIDEMYLKMDPDQNKYLTYFSTLITMGKGPITMQELESRYNRMCQLPEFSSYTTIEEKNLKERELRAATYVIAELIKENGGSYRHPEELRDIELKTYYAKRASIDELSDEDVKILKKINQAKVMALKRFIPDILLKPDKGVITTDTVNKQYNEILSSDLFGPNTEIEVKMELEKIYQAIQLTLSENEGVIAYDDINKILRTYENNIPKVEHQAKIKTILSTKERITEESLAEMFEIALDENEDDEIRKLENVIDFEIAYCAIVKEIKRRNGSCTSQEATEAYNRALENVEKYRSIYRKKTKSPFLVFPKKEKGKEDEIYTDLLRTTKQKIEEISSVTRMEEIAELVGRVKAYGELYDIVKDPTKRRELEEVKFDVDASMYADGYGVCDLQYIRSTNPTDIATLENSVGDEIRIVETGRLGFSAMRQPNGQPNYTDSITTKEYEVVKVYHSTCEKDEKPQVRRFRVFSTYIDKNVLEKDPVIAGVYANQIFSDMSLEAAEEKNGGAIATAQYENSSVGKKPKIYFDSEMVSACIKMKSVLKEYSDYEEKIGMRRVPAKRMKNGALVGNSSVKLSNGYATMIMSHINADNPKNDELFAFEWSDIQKKRTIFDTITRSRLEK